MDTIDRKEAMNRGRIVIFVILGLAIGATVFAAWFRWSQGHRVLEFLGPTACQQIRMAPKVELIWIEPPQFGTAPRQRVSADESISINGIVHRVLGRADISSVRGLIHARQSLVQDATYRWNEPPSPSLSSEWSHALIFSDPANATNSTVLLFDLSSDDWGLVRQLEGSEALRLTIPGGFRTFFSEQDGRTGLDAARKSASPRR